MERENFILITGASSGIGREIAIRLSKEHNVIINGRNSEQLSLTKELCSTNTSQLIWQYDLNNIENVEDAVSSFIKENDISISHFVHCAGYMKTYPLKMVNLSLLSSTFNINVFSATLIIKTLTNKRLNANALKSIVLISSNISNFGAKAFSVYGASKSALDGIMRSLAVELAPNVRINSVLPGSVRTTMTEQIFENEELIERMSATYPLGLGDVNDIYEAVAFLLFDHSRWITGQQLFVDGGRTINISG